LLRHGQFERSNAAPEAKRSIIMAAERPTIDLRIEITQEMVRELLWHAIAPDATVLQRELTNAIEQQQSLLDVSLVGYQITGISVVNEHEAIFAELRFTLA
jgi:hypothetical protein